MSVFNTSPVSGQVKIKYGTADLPVEAGSTVASIRSRFAGVLGVPSDAKAHVNGDEVNEDYVPSPGQTVVFMRKTGEKGNS